MAAATSSTPSGGAVEAAGRVTTAGGELAGREAAGVDGITSDGGSLASGGGSLASADGGRFGGGIVLVLVL
jgi:hypothetical protein